MRSAQCAVRRGANQRTPHSARRTTVVSVMCYSDTVKNITVSVDDEVYRSARVKAAELSTSVSSLVREFLVSLSQGESDFDRRKRLQDEVLAALETKTPFRAGARVSRDEAHHRRAIR